MQWYPHEAEVVTFYGPVAVLIISVVVVSLLRFIAAPYGRYQNTAFGFIIPARFAWILQETPSAAAALWFALGNSSHHTLANTAILSLLVTHYAYRSWIYPFMLKTKHGFPLVTFLAATGWCLYNGYVMGRYFGEFGPVYSTDYLMSPMFLIGASLWAFGFAINIHSDYTLCNLRKPGETGYKIPMGGAFTYVSGANYFSEILEWTGFALASGGALPALSFAVFTASNIGPRAFEHHRWYLEKFGDKYPKNRKALIPFLL